MRLASSHFDPRAAFVSLAAHGFAVGAIAVASAGLGPTPPTVEPARVNYVVIEVPFVALQETTAVPPAPEAPLPSMPLPSPPAETPQLRKPVVETAAAKIAMPKAPTPKARPEPSLAAGAARQFLPEAPSSAHVAESEADAATGDRPSEASAASTQASDSTREGEPTPARDDRPTSEVAAAQLPVIREARFRVPPSPPIYPRRAIELDLRGTTILRALVDANGTAAEIVVWASSGLRLLDEAALAAARRWKFEPARDGAVAVAAWVEVPVRFELR